MELTNISNIKSLLSRHGFSFSKSLGQNFIINPSVCPRIAEQGGCSKSTCALEIGTGIGVLTKELALKCEKVVAIEIDKSLEPILNETLAEFNNVEVIFDDIMKIDLSKLFKKHFDGKDVVVCANLPYYITSPIIMHLLESTLPIKSITVMVQKEAGERICADVGTRESSALTVGVNYYSSPKKLFNVTRGSFVPSPKVDSCVIRLDIKESDSLKLENEDLFFKIVSACFSQRRKQISNPIAAVFKIKKDRVAEFLKQANIPVNSRAENLKMNDFVSLYQVFLENEVY
ncbi:MAG: 16S rRNA (adenine(1518)-N(6)/adenine(1519)-N(6))-dimethyltransferase RsmA [Clostridiales bacterium]|nr:16S rRNA (adenine(1518)-N(6)/adenine(1519)-N(6))-dimethyltransferase RsmA [Clostridiales bacterium]